MNPLGRSRPRNSLPCAPNEAVHQRLSALTQAAEGPENLMPCILTAIEACATTGEICNTLRAVWGEYNPEVFT